MKNQSRTIEVKTLLNDIEFAEFQNECAVADVKHSPLIRNLLKGWLADRQTNHKRKSDATEWPGSYHRQAMLLPSRGTNYGSVQMRMLQ